MICEEGVILSDVDMRRAEQQKIRPHRFLDLNQSEIVKILKMKLW